METRDHSIGSKESHAHSEMLSLGPRVLRVMPNNGAPASNISLEDTFLQQCVQQGT